MTGIMLHIAYHKAERSAGSLVRLFYRDGIAYYVLLSGKYYLDARRACSSAEPYRCPALAIVNIVMIQILPVKKSRSSIANWGC